MDDSQNETTRGLSNRSIVFCGLQVLSHVVETVVLRKIEPSCALCSAKTVQFLKMHLFLAV